ncbi:MAG: type I restriction endonuclease subunit R [Candidatus Mcinerneyibacterium aminivorans]|uniref:Type I restriction enzyme endonuclease subunit n=1 Tax=Candidatus Mcinerneyibacterium aminivorans TaxID=2703815 RepID=A0A5D0MDV3_9BACT|nr:MAG: type I restriction endonuclease subunit R [Candidatus Mcinerneyibacterium aminivorans]
MFNESSIEEAVIEWFKELGYTYIDPEKTSPEEKNSLRNNYEEVIFKERLKDSLFRINRKVPSKVIETAFKKISFPESPDFVINNKKFQNMITDGIDIEYRTEKGQLRTEKVWVFDHENINKNDWIVTNQFTVVEDRNTRRPDVLVFVNGLPLGLFELKNISDEKKTLTKSYNQIKNYKNEIPSLFNFNQVISINDGYKCKVGTISSNQERFMPWKTIDGENIAPKGMPEVEVVIKGIFKKTRFLEIIKYFSFFQNHKNLNKILAAYHQYHAVKKAVARTHLAIQNQADNRIGIVWHTTGSGKSISMVFYAGKLVLSLNNPTIVIITDRNDLDKQLFETFSKSKGLLRQNPKQAKSREHLKKLLSVTSGGIIFTTIQKFEKNENDPVLTDRENVVVIADEAHRSQYGFDAEVKEKNNGEIDLVYGYAKYMRDALPNASFIGFTGTPIEKKDKSTPAIFGDYIDIYDMTRSIKDEMTVPIYYESRIIDVRLPKEEKRKIDKKIGELSSENNIYEVEKYKNKYSRLEAVVGADNRLEKVANEVIEHFKKRQEAIKGKAMIVTISREVGVKLYNKITSIKPEWHSESDEEGQIKLVMSGSAEDPEDWQIHIRNKSKRKKIEKRFKDPEDNLKMVIVCDMWLTGFDVPPLHTMYVDKPLKGHNVIQAISRVNRVYKDKPGGLVVDLIGIADSLKKALSEYTESDRKNTGIDNQEALNELIKEYEIVKGILHGFDYKRFFEESSQNQLKIITEAVEFLLSGEENEEKRFIKHVMKMQRAFALCSTLDKAQKINKELGFFKAVKSALKKNISPEEELEDKEIEGAINQMVSKSIVTDGVIDIFKDSKLNTPDLSILSDEFLEDVKKLQQKNIAARTLERLLKVRVREMGKTNLIKSRKFSKMLEDTIERYNNRQIETKQVIEELIKLAKEMKKEHERNKDSDLSEEELAFYDALSQNESAKEILGDETLKKIATELKKEIIENLPLDWVSRKSKRAKVRIQVKRLLRKYDYPPDKQEEAVETVLEQTELMCKKEVE